MVPKCKNSNASNSNRPKRSYRMILLSEKMKVLELRKKMHAEVAKIYSKSSIC